MAAQPLAEMTQYEQIWRFIKDHPDCSVAQMAKAFGRPEKAVGGDCWSLAQRKMIVSAKFKPLHGWPYLIYRIPHGMREYELLPKPLKKKVPPPVVASAPSPAAISAPTAPAVQEVAQVHTVTTIVAEQATVELRMQAIADRLTLGEARVLQSILNGVLRQ